MSHFRALESHGCPVVPRRHLACEPLPSTLDAGFDLDSSQIVLCSDKTGPSPSRVASLLAHEMVHAFDRCTAHVDFADSAHLACTEVRAAALVHCRTVPCVTGREECVKGRAVASVVAVKGVTPAEAREQVDRVFDKCYADKEPFGRFAYDAASESAAEQEYETFTRWRRKRQE